jgi:hypothetical protein
VEPSGPRSRKSNRRTSPDPKRHIRFAFLSPLPLPSEVELPLSPRRWMAPRVAAALRGHPALGRSLPPRTRVRIERRTGGRSTQRGEGGSRPDLGRWSTTGRLHQGRARRHDEGPGGDRTPSASAVPGPRVRLRRLKRSRRDGRNGHLGAEGLERRPSPRVRPFRQSGDDPSAQDSTTRSLRAVIVGMYGSATTIARRKSVVAR